MYHIGDKLHIRVIRADKQSRQIDFEKVDQDSQVDQDRQEEEATQQN